MWFSLSVPPRIVDSLSSSDMVQVMRIINYCYNPDDENDNETHGINEDHGSDDGKKKES